MNLSFIFPHPPEDKKRKVKKKKKKEEKKKSEKKEEKKKIVCLPRRNSYFQAPCGSSIACAAGNMTSSRA